MARDYIDEDISRALTLHSDYYTNIEIFEKIKLAFDAEDDDGICRATCLYNRPECQGCIERALPEQCTELSGNPCWHCASPIIKEFGKCQFQHDNSLEVNSSKISLKKITI